MLESYRRKPPSSMKANFSHGLNTDEIRISTNQIRTAAGMKLINHEMHKTHESGHKMNLFFIFV
jgi:hypothetical protein